MFLLGDGKINLVAGVEILKWWVLEILGLPYPESSFTFDL
jgi:hypothetical protein